MLDTNNNEKCNWFIWDWIHLFIFGYHSVYFLYQNHSSCVIISHGATVPCLPGLLYEYSFYDVDGVWGIVSG